MISLRLLLFHTQRCRQIRDFFATWPAESESRHVAAKAWGTGWFLSRAWSSSAELASDQPLGNAMLTFLANPG